MSKPNSRDWPILSRRRLLGAGAATLGAGIVLGPSSAADAVVATGDTSQEDGFYSGTLVSAGPGWMTVQVMGTELTVAHGPGTDFCRGACGQLWSVLKSQDRIDVFTEALPGVGVRRAVWVNANMITGWAEIEEMGDNWILASPISYGGAYRRILIKEYTVVVTSDGHHYRGGVGSLQVGDYLHYTGTADSPNPGVPVCWAMRVTQLA